MIKLLIDKENTWYKPCTALYNALHNVSNRLNPK
jgi:hypothetical protein